MGLCNIGIGKYELQIDDMMNRTRQQSPQVAEFEQSCNHRIALSDQGCLCVQSERAAQCFLMEAQPNGIRDSNGSIHDS